MKMCVVLSDASNNQYSWLERFHHRALLVHSHCSTASQGTDITVFPITNINISLAFDIFIIIGISFFLPNTDFFFIFSFFKWATVALIPHTIWKVTTVNEKYNKVKGLVEWKYNEAENGNTQMKYKYLKIMLKKVLV